MPTTIPTLIREFDAVRKELRAEAASSRELLTGFLCVDSASGAGVLRRLLSEGRPSHTAAAFTAFALCANSQLDQQGKELVDALVHQVRDHCLPEIVGTANPAGPTGALLVASNYKLPIYVAGTLSLLHADKLRIEPTELQGLVDGTKRLRDLLLQPGSMGFLSRVGKTTAAEPSAYHTLWAVQSLMIAASLKVKYEAFRQLELETAFRAAKTWAERALASHIADHHSKNIARVDPTEMACAVALVVLHVPSDSQPAQAADLPSEDALRLAAHTLELLFSEYSNKGSLTRGRPVFSGTDQDSIFCSTAEAMFYLVSSDNLSPIVESRSAVIARRDQLLRPHLQALLVAYNSVTRMRAQGGYVPDYDGAYDVRPVPNIFATSASVSFMEGLSSLLDRTLDFEARRLLDVPPFREDPKLARITIPERLNSVLRHYMVEPLLKGERSRAYYSAVFHGPPGTAKTTLARKISQELRWPLLIVTQRDFLSEGSQYIDAAADRLFYLVGLLRDVVVLFDELEELILARDGKDVTDRESRLLTTSMLPRIQELRDARSIVFLFATNRLREFDGAVIRPGRFDLIQLVAPPATSVLKSHLDALLVGIQCDTGLSDEHRNRISELVSNVNPELGQTFRDIELFFGELVRRVRADKGNIEPNYLLKNYISISSEVLKHFETLGKTHDRPQS